MNFFRKFIHANPETAEQPPIRGLQAEPEKSCYAKCLIFLVLLLPFSGWIRLPAQTIPQLEKIRQRGELRFITHDESLKTYESARGVIGLEHELARLFANRLGVEARFFSGKSGVRTNNMLAGDEADVAVGMPPTPPREVSLRFGPVYRQIPNDTDIVPAEIPRTPGQATLLRTGLSGKPLGRDYEYPVAWALSRDRDISLYIEVKRFFAGIKADKRLEQLTDRYLSHPQSPLEQADPELERHFKKRLPGLKRWFMQAGRRYNLDWRLLAAIAYQESRWEKRAVSPEGVKGLMMLTQTTARELKISNRTDPATSIMGAAAYLRQTLAHIPPEIPDPDRTWYALAAYNLGYGHIEQARKLVQRRKGNPDMWVEIRKVLPRMNDLPRLGRGHKSGHRGTVTVDYVHHIRQYYDRLVWMTERKTGSATSGQAGSDSI